ncbi:MAG: phage portal protein [Actinobacteria bacterium]|nr:phage portal protein [Actinomycetota bacterium]
MGLLERVADARSGNGRGEARTSIDQWISEYLLPATGAVNQFTYGGHVYPFGSPNFTYGANKAREFSADLPGHTAALKSCPPAFAAQMVRALVLSQARFVYRNRRGYSATPGRIFGTRDLSILERPWPGGTTGDLIGRMEWHAGLAGNAFVTNWQQNNRLRVLRPDWTAVVYGSQREPDDPRLALDGEIIGYVYQNGGIYPGNQNDLITLPTSSVAHWMPQPDPLAADMGMSWVTPAIREIQGDMLTSQHKIVFFQNAGTPNLVVKGITAPTKDQFDEIVDMLEERHTGVANAYRTLYLTAGADATPVGSSLQEMDFRGVLAGGETRIAYLSRVPSALLGNSEGLSGSSLNAGNFSAARRLFGDSWIFPTLQNLASTLAPLVNVPADAELWFDTSDMPILREDAKDAAEIQQVNANTITTLVKDGFDPDSAIAAVNAQDMTLLKHTGLVSVQLQPPRTDYQKAQTVQLESLAAELLIRGGYTSDSARDAVVKQDLSLLEPGPLTSRYLVVNPLVAGAEPGVPQGFPDAGHEPPPPAPNGSQAPATGGQ